MASIKKLKNGSFQATISVGRDNNNKQILKYITRQTERECKAAAREYEQQLYNKTMGNIPNMKVSTFMDKWVEIVSPSLASSTIRTYEQYITGHFKPYFGNIRLEQVTELFIRAYIAEKLKYLSPTTVRKHFFTLKKIFYDALKLRSPCRDITPPETNYFKPSVPTDKEFKQIWDCFKSYGMMFELTVLLAGWNGMRRGEIFALKPNDINFKEGDIRVDEAIAMAREGYSFEFKLPKSKNGIRTIATPDYAIKLLKKYIDKNEIANNDPLFTMKPDQFSTRFREIIQQNNLPKFRFHDLRHYHASFLYKNKIPDKYASVRLGHDIMVLKRMYQHLGLEEQSKLDKKVKNFYK